MYNIYEGFPILEGNSKLNIVIFLIKNKNFFYSFSFLYSFGLLAFRIRIRWPHNSYILIQFNPEDWKNSAERHTLPVSNSSWIPSCSSSCTWVSRHDENIERGRDSAKIQTRQCENTYAAVQKYERGSAKIQTRQCETMNPAVRK